MKPTKLEQYNKVMRVKIAYQKFLDSASKVSIDNEYAERIERAVNGIEKIIGKYEHFLEYKPKKNDVVEYSGSIDCGHWFRYNPEKLSMEQLKELFMLKNKFFYLLYELVDAEDIKDLTWNESEVSDVIMWCSRCFQ